MARAQSQQILSQFNSARSYGEQTAALRALRDDIIGHVQRKEWWVQNGILPSLVKILRRDDGPLSKLNGKERSRVGQPRELLDAEVAPLLVLQLLASFAYGERA